MISITGWRVGYTGPIGWTGYEGDREKEVQVSHDSTSSRSVGWQQQGDKKRRRTGIEKADTKKQTHYPHLIPLRQWLAHREGVEGVRKLGEAGLAKVEEAYLRRNRDVLDRDSDGVQRTVMVIDGKGVDVEKVGEEQLRRIIVSLESGPKTVQVRNGEKEELYVSLLALGPHWATGTIKLSIDII